MKTEKRVINFFILSILIISLIPFISAGAGLKWSEETALIPENSNVCLTYGVYNPWPKDSYVKIQLSDSLKEIITSSSGEVDLIPGYTYSNSSIPVNFCFKTPSVYKEDCLLFNSLICSQTCNETMKLYSGQVEVLESSSSKLDNSGSGGSSTAMSVSAPLTVKVKCVPHSRNYSIVYFAVGIIALAFLLWKIYKRKKKSRGEEIFEKRKK